MSMDHCVVHEYDDVSVLVSFILYDCWKHLVYKVLKDHCINRPLYNLISNDWVLRYCWYHCQRIVLPFELLLLLLQLHRNHSKLSEIVVVSLLMLIDNSILFSLLISPFDSHWWLFFLMLDLIVFAFFIVVLFNFLESFLQLSDYIILARNFIYLVQNSKLLSGKCYIEVILHFLFRGVYAPLI